MKVNLLRSGYLRNKEIYQDFVNDNLNAEKDYFETSISLPGYFPDFPIYTPDQSFKKSYPKYREAIDVLMAHYNQIDRKYRLDGRFWHSLLITQKREFLIKTYPEILEDYDRFNRIVFRKFDWENYIYKFVLMAEYLNEYQEDVEKIDRIVEAWVDNRDLYNYMIKSEVLRNKEFVLSFFELVSEMELSDILRSKIQDIDGDDRYGRKVLREFSNSYPVIPIPILNKELLKLELIKILKQYHPNY